MFGAFNVSLKRKTFAQGFLLLTKELKKNRFTFLAPLPLWMFLVGFLKIHHPFRLELGASGTWSFFAAAIILAIVYGLQCFSDETERNTLDFILTRPVSPYWMIMVKYVLSLSVLFGWLILFQAFLALRLSVIPLPAGIGSAWLYVTLAIVHGMSFLAGLIKKGLERLFIINVMTLFIAGLSYYLWRKVFELVAANYYWPDVPQYLEDFLAKTLPFYLTMLSLATPLVGVIWYLRSRTRLWSFKPAWWLAGIWLATFLLIMGAQKILAPPLWPNESVQTGDWSVQSGIVLVGPDELRQRSLFKTHSTLYRLAFTRLGKKPRTIYQGINLSRPSFSPDGKTVIFSENGRLRLYDIRTGKVKKFGRGDLSTWSEDGRKIIYAKRIGKNGWSRLFLFNLHNGEQTELLTSPRFLTGLAWDSSRNRLYMLNYGREMECLDLKTKKIEGCLFEKNAQPQLFGIVHPSLKLSRKADLLFIGQVFNQVLRIYALDLKSQKIALIQEKDDFRLKSNGPVLMNDDFSALMYQRFDGSFGYEATYRKVEESHHHHDGERDED